MQPTVTIGIDELHAIKRKADDAQGWRDVANSLYGVLFDIVFDDRDGTGNRCACCGHLAFGHEKSCRAEKALLMYIDKQGWF